VETRERVPEPPRTRSASPPEAVLPSRGTEPLLKLQHAAGNRAVTRLLARRSGNWRERPLRPGEVLHIETRRALGKDLDRRFSDDYTVASDGTVTFGSGREHIRLQVAGLTVLQVAQRLAQALVDEQGYMQPSVTVTSNLGGMSVTESANARAAKSALEREREPYLKYIAALDADDARVKRYLAWVNARDAVTLSEHTPAERWAHFVPDPDAPPDPRALKQAEFDLAYQAHYNALKELKDPTEHTRALIVLDEFREWIDRHSDAPDLLKASPADIYSDIVLRLIRGEVKRTNEAKLEQKREAKKPTLRERSRRFNDLNDRVLSLHAEAQAALRPESIDHPARRKATLIMGRPAVAKVKHQLAEDVQKWAYTHLQDDNYLEGSVDDVVERVKSDTDFRRKLDAAERETPPHEEVSTVEKTDVSAAGVLASFGKAIGEALATVAAIGLFVGAEIITGGQATWLLVGLAASQGVQDYMGRRERIEAAGYDVPVSETLLESAGDFIGVTQLVEGMSGTELGSGLELSGEEREKLIGGGAANVALALGGSHAFLRGRSLGETFRRRFPESAELRPRTEPSPRTPGALERRAREALTKQQLAGFDLWMDDIRSRGRDPEIALRGTSARQVEGMSEAMIRRRGEQAAIIEEAAFRPDAPADPLRPTRATFKRAAEALWLHYDTAPPPPLDVALALKIAEATGEPVHLYGPEPGGKAAPFDGTIGNPPRPLALDLHRMWEKAGLEPAGLERVLKAVSPERGRQLVAWLGPGRLDALGADASLLKRAVALDERITPHLSDHRAHEGILRLTGPDVKKLGTRAILDNLEKLPPDALGLALRMFGDPSIGNVPSFRWASVLGKNHADMLEMLHFIDDFGYEPWQRLSKAKIADPLREDLARLHSLEERRARVEELLGMSTVEREVALGIRRPPPFRKLTDLRPIEDATWSAYREDARDVIDRNAELKGPRRKQPYGKGNQQAIDAYATILQIRDRVRTHFERYQKELSQEAKEQLLDRIDALGEKADLQNTWIINLRGSVAEALVGPHGGLAQERLANPLHPAEAPKKGQAEGPAEAPAEALPGAPAGATRPGFTRLDDFYEPGTRPRGTGGGPATPGREWVEIKSDRIDQGPGGDRVDSDAVGASRRYAKGARADWDALLSNEKTRTRGDGIVMHWVRKPRSQATIDAMLGELFSKDSPIRAVRFGDDPWIERPASNPMPDIHPDLREGPIVGVPPKKHVYGPEP